jgi:hypothetical protein
LRPPSSYEEPANSHTPLSYPTLQSRNAYVLKNEIAKPTQRKIVKARRKRQANKWRTVYSMRVYQHVARCFALQRALEGLGRADAGAQ